LELFEDLLDFYKVAPEKAHKILILLDVHAALSCKKLPGNSFQSPKPGDL